jgi:Ca2+-transporting ATPase
MSTAALPGRARHTAARCDGSLRWTAVALSVGLQVAVIYVPFLQRAFSTTPLNVSDWLRCVAVASSVLWLRELTKLVARVRAPRRA